MRRPAHMAVNAALALAALGFLTLVAFVAAGRASSATAAPNLSTRPTFSSTTAPPSTTPPPTAPPTTAPRPPATTVPPATAPPSRTARTTPLLPRTTIPTPGLSNQTPLLPASTVATTTTTTTIAAIGGRLPPAPVTLPLTTKSSSAHVDPLFAWLSGIGFLVATLIMAGRFLFTWPRRPRTGTEGRT